MATDGSDFDIVVAGSIVQDFTSYTTRFPNPGESVRGHGFSYACGGKGANQAVMGARLGAKVAMVGKVGDDVLGKEQMGNFSSNGVNVSVTVVLSRVDQRVTGVFFKADEVTKTDKSSTATGAINVNESGQNTIAVVVGANALLTADDVRRAESKIAKAKVVVCQLETTEEASLEALKLGKKHGATTIFNPAPDPPKGISNPDFYKYTDIICPNEHEAEGIAGFSVKTDEDVERALSKFLDRGVKTVVITLGERGVAFASSHDKTPHRVHVPRVKAVDVTGAGDSFVGSLAYFTAIHPQMPLQERIRRSCQIAAISVQSAGTQQSYPKREQIPKEILDD